VVSQIVQGNPFTGGIAALADAAAARDPKRVQPFLQAASEGDTLSAIRLLDEHGEFFLQALTQSQQSREAVWAAALQRALKGGHEPFVRLLVRKSGPKAIELARAAGLQQACKTGDTATVRMLLAAGVDAAQHTEDLLRLAVMQHPQPQAAVARLFLEYCDLSYSQLARIRKKGRRRQGARAAEAAHSARHARFQRSRPLQGAARDQDRSKALHEKLAPAGLERYAPHLLAAGVTTESLPLLTEQQIDEWITRPQARLSMRALVRAGLGGQGRGGRQTEQDEAVLGMAGENCGWHGEFRVVPVKIDPELRKGLSPGVADTALALAAAKGNRVVVAGLLQRSAVSVPALRAAQRQAGTGPVIALLEAAIGAAERAQSDSDAGAAADCEQLGLRELLAAAAALHLLPLCLADGWSAQRLLTAVASGSINKEPWRRPPWIDDTLIGALHPIALAAFPEPEGKPTKVNLRPVLPVCYVWLAVRAERCVCV
jgi:hypothetical protein